MDINNEYGTLEVQQGLLLLIKEFDSFCKTNSIRYSLAWGSLLGAIRHKGFIPWDDDLDVMMDRENYKLFLSKISDSRILKLKQSDECLWVDRIQFNNYKKIASIYPTLDIFVVDNAPDSSLQRKWMVFKILMLQGMLKKHPDFSKGSFGMRICTIGTWFLGLFITNRKKMSLYEKWSQNYNDKKTIKLGSYNTEFVDLPKLYDSDMMLEYINVPFEDTFVSIVKNYDSCLKVMFGNNYMIPPIDKKPKHLK